MRTSLFLLGGLLLFGVIGCEESPTQPGATGGEVLIFWHMPEQRVVNDEQGNHLQSRRAGLFVENVRIELADGSIVSPTQRGPNPVDMVEAPDDSERGTQLLARFQGLPSPPVRLHGTLTPRGGAPGNNPFVLEGASVAVEFAFNGVVADSLQNFGAAVSQFSFRTPLQLALPAVEEQEFQETGLRVRAIVDPNEWLFDRNSRQLVNIGDLTRTLFPDPTSPGYQQVRTLLLESLRAEQF